MQERNLAFVSHEKFIRLLISAILFSTFYLHFPATFRNEEIDVKI